MGTALEIAGAFMELQFGVPVTVCQNPETVFNQYQKAHCFSAGAQGCYTVKGLEDFYAKADKHTVYELREPLGTLSLRFFLCGTLVIIGPYTDKEWEEASAVKLLAKLRMSPSTLQAYKLYKCGYSVLHTNDLLQAVAAMIELEGENFESYNYHKLEEKGTVEKESLIVSERYDYRRINEELALKKMFMGAVANGEEMRALKLLDKMSRQISQSRLAIAKSGSYRLEAATIMRTIVRLAAQQSSLPPIVVDAITESYAQRLVQRGKLPSADESKSLIVDMIRELCAEIHRQQLAGYSPVVCKAKHYVRMNLGHDLAVPILAQEMGISPAYLSKIFRTETGEGISLYIRRQRCSKAAELLCTTQHTVQDIGSLVGFNDANYFIKVFKKAYGTTPARYRNRNL